MYNVMRAYLDILRQHGVDGLDYYSFIQPISQYGPWGTMDYLGEPSNLTPKYNALRDYASTVSVVPTATYLQTDTTTQGNWKGVYGAQGYNVIDNQASYPSYAAVTPYAYGNWVWSNSTTAAAALQKANSTDRISALWYSSSSFTVDLYLNDGLTHQVALYALDGDSTSRRERIDVVDPLTGTVLDSRTISSFSSGVYLVWALTGHVQLRLTRLAGANAALSGLFFDGYNGLSVNGFPSQTTAGIPQTFTVAAEDPNGNVLTGYTGTVHFISSDLNAILPPDYTFTAADAGVHTFTATLETAGAQSITARDTAFPGVSGAETGIITSPAAASALLLAGVPSIAGSGIAQSFTVTAEDTFGNVATGYAGTIHFTSTDPNAVLPPDYTFTAADNGIHTFTVTLSTPGTQSVTATDTSTATITGTEAGISVKASVGTTVTFVGTNTTTHGSWNGVYGSQGYNVIGNQVSYPSYATVSASGESNWVWYASTTTAQALQKVNASDRIAASWYSGSSFTVDVNLTDGALHQVALYVLDGDNSGRVERIDVVDPVSGAVLDSHTISSFSSGIYLVWNLSGHVQLRITHLTGTNAAISGLFFDGTSPLNITGFPWQTVVGVSHGFTVTAVDSNGNLLTGYTGTVHFTSSDPNAVLPSDYTFTAADAGVHTFTVTLPTVGTQWITVTDTASPSITGTQSGIVVHNLTSAKFLRTDTATGGTWKGVYGTQGYNVVGDQTSYPSYATTTISGASKWVWNSSTTDPRALEKVQAAGRIEALLYSTTSFTVDLNFTDGGLHQVAIYALDGDSSSRSEQVDVIDPLTGAVLDTRSISSFHNGAYLVWSLAGHVQLRFTHLAGANAALSGLFFD
jgi:hypothetical protein